MAAVVAFGPAAVARPASVAALVVLAAGLVGGIAHTGLFFLPALVVMAIGAVRLWREQP